VGIKTYEINLHFLSLSCINLDFNIIGVLHELLLSFLGDTLSVACFELALAGCFKDIVGELGSPVSTKHQCHMWELILALYCWVSHGSEDSARHVDNPCDPARHFLALLEVLVDWRFKFGFVTSYE